jgi:UDP-N-acetylmuramoyl-tripeptide--D-alanyl-D-alanine ligase
VNGITAAVWIAAGSCWIGLVPSGSRWLRVAQREHYLAGSATRFAFRWWIGVRSNAPLFVAAIAGTALSWRFPLIAIVTAVVVVVAPLGLSVRGRTSPLGATRRLRTLAVTWSVLEAGVVVIGVVEHRLAFFSALALVLGPPLIDLACLITSPIEHRLGSRFVAQAASRLKAVNPTVVGITGSFGKTSTKNYVTHLVGHNLAVLASPASFNNRAGLARAINEHLVARTEVFVAEMGTYGRGEIAELCSWCPPQIAVMTAIGPVHLERFGSEEAILEAKAEIVENASTVVLNIDDERLARFADALAHRAKASTIIRCSAVDPLADVCVLEDSGVCEVFLTGEQVGVGVVLAEGVQPSNVACALGVAHALGVPHSELVTRLHDLPSVPHRLAVATAQSGVVVIDDTFNSNPAGARAALGVLAGTAGRGRRVVVTPGMVELGSRQSKENQILGRASLETGTDLVVVGRTNRAALAVGAGSDRVITVRTREDAVQWVRENLASGDAVLYENDLPDHYP